MMFHMQALNAQIHQFPPTQTLMAVSAGQLMGRCALQGREIMEEGEGARLGETMRRAWEDLGVVDTIYEEDQEEEEDFNSLSPTSNPTSSHSSSAPPSPSLRSLVDSWSRATGYKPNVVVRVHDQSFNLHRDPLVSRSGYLRRRLTESPNVAVTPPSNITAEEFCAAARFCYGSDVALSPLNLAAVRVTAEWLEMTADDDGGGGGLVGRTEEYFEREVAGDAEGAAQVLRACAVLLPEAAGMAGRCVAALAALGMDDEAWLDDVASLSAEEFGTIAEAMRRRVGCDHDLLYRVVDAYLEINHKGKLSEEEKNRICHAVDCRKLSPHVMMHLVQNPRLPLRFVVQAMLLDQLHTRRSFLHHAASATGRCKPGPPSLRVSSNGTGGMTLGAILQRDAVLRQAAHMRATMEATNFRIQSLERDLEGMRRRLRWSEEKRADVESARSESFRIIRHERQEVDGEVAVASLGKSCKGNVKNGRSFGKKLFHGLKSMFRTSSAKLGVESHSSAGGGDGDIVVVVQDMQPRHRDMQPRHRRNRSCT